MVCAQTLPRCMQPGNAFGTRFTHECISDFEEKL